MVKIAIIAIIVGAIPTLIGLLLPDKVPRLVRLISAAVLLIGIVFKIILLVKQSQQEATEKYVGVLEAKSKIPTSSDQNIVPKLQIANTGTIIWLDGGDAAKFIHELLKDNNFKAVIEEGRLKVSMTIIDKDGEIVAEIARNEWKVNPNNSFDRNYSTDSLEVKDSLGDIILQLRLVADRVQIQGRFYRSKSKLYSIEKVIGAEIGDEYEDDEWVNIHLITKDFPAKLKIRPMFKYPSDLHMGKFVDKKD